MSHLIIESPAALRTLRRHPMARFELAIADLGPDNALWEERLRRDHEECGCTAGTIGLIAGIAAGIIGGALTGQRWWTVVAASVVLGGVALAIAKAVRLYVARLQLDATIAEIEALIRARAAGRGQL